MKRKVLAVLMVLMITTGFIFAAGAQEAEDEQMTFGFSVMSLGNPYFISVVEGFEDRCEELGVKSLVVDAKYDVAKQVSDIENMMISEVDGMVISPIDQNALTVLVDQAKEQGIAVVSEAQRVDNAHGIYTIDEYVYGVAIGENAARWINEKLDGKAEVIIISQDNVEPVIQRGNGIQDTIEKSCPGAVVVARQAGDSPEEGMKIVESVLQNHPNVKVITGNNDSGALGGYEAVKAMGMATDDFFVGGADATAEALSKMEEPGSVYRATVDILPYQSGRDVADLLYKYNTEGLPVEPEVVLMTMAPVWQDGVW